MSWISSSSSLNRFLKSNPVKDPWQEITFCSIFSGILNPIEVSLRYYFAGDLGFEIGISEKSLSKAINKRIGYDQSRFTWFWVAQFCAFWPWLLKKYLKELGTFWQDFETIYSIRVFVAFSAGWKSVNKKTWSQQKASFVNKKEIHEKFYI